MSGSNDGRRGPRRLAPDERRLWERVAGSAVPLSRRPDDPPSRPRTERPAPGTPAEPLQHEPQAPARHDLRARRRTIGYDLAGPEVAPVGRPEAGLDRRTAERLRRGVRAPDARIDLHGMRAERAHAVCLRFLADALARGHRLVLVITGKGRAAGDEGPGTGKGVLRGSLPGWLRASPLGPAIVGIYQAHPRHGGDGAYYVYLKRRR